MALLACTASQPDDPAAEQAGDESMPETPAMGTAGMTATAAPGAPAGEAAPEPAAAGGSAGPADAAVEPVDEFAQTRESSVGAPAEDAGAGERDAAAPDSGAPATAPADAGTRDTPPEVDPVEPSDDSVCGDGVIEGGEECEFLNLNGMTCESLSAGSGLLGCDPQTCRFDTSLCIPPLSCGRFGCIFPTL